MVKATRGGVGGKEEESATDVAAHLLIGASRPRAASRAQKAKVVVYVVPSVSTVPLWSPFHPCCLLRQPIFPSTCRVLSLACVTPLFLSIPLHFCYAFRLFPSVFFLCVFFRDNCSSILYNVFFFVCVM